MTKPRRDNEDTPFSAWLRNHPELQSSFGYDAENLDYAWHDYKRGHLMILEEKRFNAKASYAQEDTFSVISQALKFAFSHPTFFVKRKNPVRPSKISYFGYHLIQFERNTPDDGSVRVDGIEVTKEEFVLFLKFDREMHKVLKERYLKRGAA